MILMFQKGGAFEYKGFSYKTCHINSEDAEIYEKKGWFRTFDAMVKNNTNAKAKKPSKQVLNG